MSNPAKPPWSTPGAFPFMPFPIPGFPPGAAATVAPPSPLAGGFDMLRTLWGSLPGASQVPGFLIPTVDLDELDKRIADLRAAESWVEVNLNMLRATIQGLEVQRHTIAALHSLSAVGEAAGAPASAGAAASPAAAFAAAMVTPPAEPSKTPVAANTAAAAAEPVAALPGLAAGQWLGYLQDQFARVAGAAITRTAPMPGAGPAAAAKKTGKAAARPRSTSRGRTPPR